MSTEAAKNEFLIKGLEECRAITKKYGTSFYFATQFFPKETRNGIYAIYAFARIPDEIVDDPTKKATDDTVAKLKDFQHQWETAMAEGSSDDAVMNAIVFMFKKYDIPVEYGHAFMRSMLMDEERSRYQNYKELEEYMYGSAGVIGLMVTKVVGYESDAALPYAVKLGYAFQLTNFIRDIREDYEELGRIYMPADELRAFGLNESDISRQQKDERFENFIRSQIDRNREIYREALPGIPMLAFRGRLAVRISYVLYKAILAEVERADYNVYAGRVRTNLRQKVWLSLKALAGVYE